MNEPRFTDFKFYFRKHLRNTIYSNVWIAFAAFMATFQTTYLLDNPNLFLSAFVGISTFFIYNFQRAIKLSQPDGYYVAGRNNWLIRNRNIIVSLTWIGGIAMCLMAIAMPFRDWLLLGLPALLSIWYAAPISIGQWKVQPLRHVPRLKLYMIGIIWATSLVALPLVHLFGWGSITTLHALLMILECFTFIVAITIPFDIRDYKLDPDRFQTLPQQIGPTYSKWIALIWLICSTACTLLLVYLGNYQLSYSVGIVLANIFAAILIMKSSSGQSELFFTGWLDGTIVVRAILGIGLLAIGNV